MDLTSEGWTPAKAHSYDCWLMMSGHLNEDSGKNTNIEPGHGTALASWQCCSLIWTTKIEEIQERDEWLYDLALDVKKQDHFCCSHEATDKRYPNLPCEEPQSHVIRTCRKGDIIFAIFSEYSLKSSICTVVLEFPCVGHLFPILDSVTIHWDHETRALELWKWKKSFKCLFFF